MLVDFLCSENDIFALKHSDMKGILREVIEHSLQINARSKPVEQRLRRYDEEKCKAIEEISKLLVASFIEELTTLSGWTTLCWSKRKMGMENVCRLHRPK